MKINPISRVPGHVSLELTIKENIIDDARLGIRSARGMELMMEKRSLQDIPVIASRICGWEPVAHTLAAAQMAEKLHELEVPVNAKAVRNIMLGAEWIAYGLTHFYQQVMPDFLDYSVLAQYKGKDENLIELKTRWESNKDGYPYLPQEATDFIKDPDLVITLLDHSLAAWNIRKELHEIAGLLGGRMPHPASIVVGGITRGIAAEKVGEIIFRMKRINAWIDKVYVSDVLTLLPLLKSQEKSGIGSGNYISYGAFPQEDGELLFPSGVIREGEYSSIDQLEIDSIVEQVGYSWYELTSYGRPNQSLTRFRVKRNGAYSFSKAPRYQGMAMETGSFARMLIRRDKNLLQLIKQHEMGPSVLTRMAARALEAKLISEFMLSWMELIQPGGVFYEKPGRQERSRAHSLLEAASGSLGHWCEAEAGEIFRYQLITGSTWNCSPQGDDGKKGTIEEALLKTQIKDNNPIEALRIVRSFGSCGICASH